MTVLANTLIFFFAFLIIYQIYSLNYTIIEGATTQYQEYSEDVLILAKQNAGNIKVLKERVDTLNGLDTKIQQTNDLVKQLQEQVDGLTNAQIASAMSDIPLME
jgi:hypothetical protein